MARFGFARYYSVRVFMSCLYSKGSANSNQAEYLAIREAFTLFSASKYGLSYGLWLESDSLNAISLILSPLSTLWRLRKYGTGIEIIKKKLSSLTISHVSRVCNEKADIIAKAGVNRLSDLLFILCC
ncbi:hypothetical protein REPUB_Repub09cG0068800 [Reevesia pubescens]